MKVVKINNLSIKVSQRVYSSLRHLIFNLFRKDPSVKYHLLNNVSLEINEGERVAFIGHNGAGKTLISKYIAKLIPASANKVIRDCSCRYLSSSPIIFDQELTGCENAIFMAKFLYSKISKEEINSALEFSELGHYLNAPFRTYSEGMKRRLILSIETIRPVDLLILDEYSLALDVHFHEKFLDRINSLISKSKVLIVIDHDREKLCELCDRGVVFDSGSVIFDGPIDKALLFYEKTKR